VGLFHYVGRPEQEIPTSWLRHYKESRLIPSATTSALPVNAGDSSDSDDDDKPRRTLGQVTFCGFAKVSDPRAFIAHYHGTFIRMRRYSIVKIVFLLRKTVA